MDQRTEERTGKHAKKERKKGRHGTFLNIYILYVNFKDNAESI
jgi:hypothetical protein